MPVEIVIPEDADDWPEDNPAPKVASPVSVESSDGKRECPDCHRRFTVNKDGSIRSHNCDGTTRVGKPASGKRGRPRKGELPKSVRKIGVAVITSGVEAGASYAVSRQTGLPRESVPAQLPDPDAMVGPLLSLAWPQIPAPAQRFISRIADEQELILCLILWGQYFATLNSFINAVNKANAEQSKGNVHEIRGANEGEPIRVPDGFQFPQSVTEQAH